MRYNFTSQYTGFYQSGFIHDVLVENLDHSSQYFYKCGEDASGWSKVFSFQTLSPVGPEESVVIGVIGDLGQTNNSEATMNHALADDSMTITLILGDMRCQV